MKNLIYHLSILVFLIISAKVQSQELKPTLTGKAVYRDISAPLREIPVKFGKVKAKDPDREIKNKFNLPAMRGLTPNQSESAVDQALQTIQYDNIPAQVAPIQNFDGMNNTWGVYPPDTQGDVGPNHYVQVVNLGFQIFNKSGVSLYGPANLSTIWTGIPAPWNGTNNGDPIVLYDQAADRWMISQFSLPNTTQYAMLIAVSQTSDPTGAWYRYVFQFGNKMPDYPKFGVWHDGYYMSVNQFISGSSWGGVGACAFERNKMLSGDPTAQMIYFDLGAAADPASMLPSDWDGTVTPLVNEPNHFTFFDDWSSATDYLKIWDFHADWTNTANSTFSLVNTLTPTAFNSVICSDGNCIPQSGTTVKLESLTDRLMYRLQYRNFGTHRSMVTCHTVEVDGTAHAGIRWYELRNAGSGWTIYQQGTYAPDALHRWMGSIAMNSQGQIALGYSVSASGMYPSIRYTGRFASDPLGQMTIPEQTIIDGTGYQSGSAARWGDYSMMSVDPVDDGTFWYTTEYIQTSGSTSWRTRIASFLFGPVAPVANFTASTTKPCINATVSFTDQTSGVPVSWQWTVTPATYAFVDGTSSTSQNPKIKFTAFGNYTITLTATNAVGSNSITKTNYISVNDANADFTASLTTLVVNNTTTFSDASTCNVNSWSWNFGDGASPATATGQGPHTVLYTTTGAKTVALTINGTITETKTNFIQVTDPIFNMSNSTITTCDGYFYDPGGSSGDYSNNQDFTMTFNPSLPGNALRFDFAQFDLEPNSTCGYDYLKIYDGSNTSAPLIGTYCGTTSPGTVTATNGSGSITFVFHSDISLMYSGWAATISCLANVGNPLTFTASPVSADQIDLAWTKNTLLNDVMIVWSPTATFGTPVNGTVYSTGSAIPGGGTVLYKGSASGVSHTSLSAGTTYYYKAFSYDAGNNYSTGLAVNASTLCGIGELPLSENFNSSTLPSCWTTQVSGTNAVNNWTVSNTAKAGGAAYEMKSTWQNVNPAVNRLVTPPINTLGQTELNLSFRHFLDGYGTGATIRVQSSTDGVVWTNEAWSLATTSSNVGPEMVNTTITNNLNSASTRIAFTIEGNLYQYDYWYIDNVSVSSNVKTLNLSLYLEGLFSGTSMRKAQNATGDQFAGNIADQVTIELRNASTGALVHTLNNVNLSTTGQISTTLPGTYSGSYYIYVKHRNSVTVSSANPVSFSGGTITYDFSNAASAAYGSNLVMLNESIYGLRTGDINQDGNVNSTDISLLNAKTSTFSTGYIPEDVNGDGITDAADLIFVDNNAARFTSAVLPF